MQRRDSCAALTQQLALCGAALGLKGNQVSPDMGEAWLSSCSTQAGEECAN